MAFKSYTTKSNAIRAAKAAGVDPTMVQELPEGGWHFATAGEIEEALDKANAEAGLATSNPAGWETAGGPTDQESGPVVALVEDPARHVVVGDVALANEPSNPAPAPAPASESEAPAKGKAAGKGAKGKPEPKGKGKAAPAKPAKAGKPGRKPKAEKAPAEPKAPRDTKLSRFVAMLQRPEGCTLHDAMEAFGWQRHTARGAIAGAIKVKLGHKVETEKVDGKVVYRIPA